MYGMGRQVKPLRLWAYSVQIVTAVLQDIGALGSWLICSPKVAVGCVTVDVAEKYFVLPRFCLVL
jgi:hypothetical protein